MVVGKPAQVAKEPVERRHERMDIVLGARRPGLAPQFILEQHKRGNQRARRRFRLEPLSPWDFPSRI